MSNFLTMQDTREELLKEIRAVADRVKSDKDRYKLEGAMQEHLRILFVLAAKLPQDETEEQDCKCILNVMTLISGKLEE